MTLKFIDYSYSGGLCKGTLTIEDTDTGNTYEIEHCLCSGGTCGVNSAGDEDVTQGPWTVNSWTIPDELRDYVEDIENLANLNVPYGCCGYCV